MRLGRLTIALTALIAPLASSCPAPGRAVCNFNDDCANDEVCRGGLCAVLADEGEGEEGEGEEGEGEEGEGEEGEGEEGEGEEGEGEGDEGEGEGEGEGGECGDGIVDAGEACDDGNANAADGCEASCSIAAGFECVGTPSFCSNAIAQVSSPLALDDALADGSIGLILLDADSYSHGGTVVLSRDVVIAGTSATRAIIDVTVSSSAVSVESNARVRLVHLQIASVGGPAIDVKDAATLVVEDCIVGPSAGDGISARDDSSVTVTRSRIRDNTGIGLLFSAPQFFVENTMVFENIGPGIDVAVAPSLTTPMVHVTVSGNGGGGVVCGSPTELAFSVVTSQGFAALLGVCDARQSGIEGAAEVNGNFSEAPSFIAGIDDDLHLAPGSPGTDACPLSTTALDIDGLRRTGVRDAGADEQR